MNATTNVLIGIFVATWLAAGAAGAAEQPKAKAKPVTLRFWGHACFTLTDGDGTTVLIDPFDKTKVGYRAFPVEPDLVLISHEHFDHNDLSWVRGKLQVLRGLAAGGAVRSVDKRFKGLRIRTVAARHWSDRRLAARGNVAILIIEAGGLRFVHLSDLGHVLEPKQIQAIGTPDVLMVPVGGFFTIDADQAYAVVQQLKPRRYVVPMHYRTASLVPALRSRLAGPEQFLRKFGDAVMRVRGNELVIDPASKPEKLQAVLLEYLPAPRKQDEVPTTMSQMP